MHAFQVEGNNTILFPKEGDLACWAESIETAVSIELRKHTSKERFEKKKWPFTQEPHPHRDLKPG